jgi:hypothetical protein
MFKNFINIVGLFSTVLLFSQNYKGNVSNIKQDGFHKIGITPEIRSASLSDLGHFRILDDHKNEVPYVVLNDESSLKSSYLPFEFKSVNNTKDSVTSIIIENKNQQKIDHLTFKIANTKVKKIYSISGSNDQKEWFGLSTNQLFLGLNEAEKTTVEQSFSFPINEYRFLRFEFSNKESLPLQILNIGLYNNFYSTIPQIKITDFKIKTITNKENKTTQIIVTFNMPQHIESMAFDIENDVFLREARILVNKTQTIKKRVETYQQNVFNFELHSGTHNIFDLPYIFENEIIIEIENNDNPPLKINHIKFFQKPVYVVSNLKKDGTYQVIIDTTLHEPNYDLVNFKTNFTSNLPEAVITDFTKIDNQNNMLSQEKPFWQTNLFMWICILLAILVIGYFSLGLIKDLKK